MSPDQIEKYYGLARCLAQANGTVQIFDALWNDVLRLARILDCTMFSSSGAKPRGVGFRNKGQILFLFWVERYGANLPGVAAISISLKQFEPGLARRLKEVLTQMSAQPGLHVPVDGNKPFDVVGFNTVEAGREIVSRITEIMCRALEQHGNAIFATKANDRGPSARAESTNPNEPPPGVDIKVWREIVERRGQAGFRRTLLAAYGSRCAVTGCTAVAALEAAHITPHSQHPCYEVSAGILLRADIHTLFDLHLLSFEPASLRLCLAPSIVDAYGELDGAVLQAPGSVASKPSVERLRRHFEEFEKVVVAND